MISSAHILAFFQNLGWPELLVIGVIALLIFGKRLPEVGRSLGKGIVEFKKGLRDTGDDIKDGMDERPKLPNNRNDRNDETKKSDSNEGKP